MTVNIPPTILPTRKPNRQHFRRPWNVDKDCVLCLMPEINSTWKDYSGRGNDGVINGATLVHNGRFGPALYFDGVNDSVNLGAPANLLALTLPLTFELWVNFSSLASTDIIVDFKATDVDARVAFGHSIVGNAVYVGHALYLVGLTPTADYITVGEWQHWVVVCIAAGNRVLYLDGVLQTLVFVPSFFNPDVLTIGARNGGADHPFQGYIDEVRIYDRMLAAWEIKALYDLGKPHEV